MPSAPHRARPWAPSGEMPDTRKIRVLHCNSAGEGWSADSPDLDGLHVTGASYDETRRVAEDEVRERVGDVEIAHHIACSRG
jgi:hypothetical protein